MVRSRARLERLCRWLSRGTRGWPAYPAWARDVVADAFPSLPILFIWGENKPFMFHDAKWAHALGSRGDGSAAVGLDTDHWVYLDDHDASVRHMDSFLARINGPKDDNGGDDGSEAVARL